MPSPRRVPEATQAYSPHHPDLGLSPASTAALAAPPPSAPAPSSTSLPAHLASVLNPSSSPADDHVPPLGPPLPSPATSSSAGTTPTASTSAGKNGKGLSAAAMDTQAEQTTGKRPDLKGKRKASEASNGKGGGAGEKEKKKVKVGARASIACKTCRKRKVRCSAEWPVCSFCQGRKMPCEYEGHPAENGGSIHAGPSGIIPNFVAASEAELPETTVLLEAMGIFFTHYYDTFPFLHRPTLTDEINNGTAPKELICCILALAARFCQSLRDLHPASSQTSPTSAPEHYARLASELLSLPETGGSQPVNPAAADTTISLSRCQCYLILGFYELTAGRDNSGWLHIGTATRMAQILRLGFEDEIPYMGEDENDPANPRARYAHNPLQGEIRRRTWWALFALDRTVSDGNERPCGLKVPRIASLRMPGPDADFIAGRRSIGARFAVDPPAWSVSTRSSRRGEAEPEADLYGHTLRIAEIWADVASYIGAGGRNVDRRPPWVEDSTFAQLARQLTEFEQRLPEVLRYSHETMTAHALGSPIEARQFGMLHLLNAGARHVLHRDYLPFLPPPDFRAANGPVDGEPLHGNTVEPSGWWQKSFDIAVASADTVSDVCTLLGEHGIVLTHPLFGFGAVAAGTVHCHTRFWPQSSSVSTDAAHYFNQDIEILNKLRSIYPIAERWYENLAGLAVLYFGVSQGVLEADPVKVRAGLLQLMRSAKDDAHADSPGSQQKPVKKSAVSQLPAIALAESAGLPKPPSTASTAYPGSTAPASHSLDSLFAASTGPSTPANGLSTSAAHPPYPPIFPDTLSAFPPQPDFMSNPLADFDLAAMQGGGLGGLGLGLSTLDDAYLYGQNGWGLAGFGGLGGMFPPPGALPPGSTGDFMGGWAL
ncbi:hypothetical protein JCM8547_007780 [Rhodosporidiobolus lusitaniae]